MTRSAPQIAAVGLFAWALTAGPKRNPTGRPSRGPPVVQHSPADFGWIARFWLGRFLLLVYASKCPTNTPAHRPTAGTATNSTKPHKMAIRGACDAPPSCRAARARPRPRRRPRPRPIHRARAPCHSWRCPPSRVTPTTRRGRRARCRAAAAAARSTAGVRSDVTKREPAKFRKTMRVHMNIA